MIRLACDETPCPSDCFNYQEGHYLSVMAIMECHPLHPYDHGRLARTETPILFKTMFVAFSYFHILMLLL